MRRGQRVLAVAPSPGGGQPARKAVGGRRKRPLRLGNPARVLPELRAQTLDGLLVNHPDMRLVRKLTREATFACQAARYTPRPARPGRPPGAAPEARQKLADAHRSKTRW